MTAVQFVGDTDVVLSSMADMGPFLDCMQTYAQATVKELNLDKVELLHVGAAGGQQAGGVDGTGRARGRAHYGPEPPPFTDASQAPEMNWEQQTEKVRERYNRIAKLPLSASGQATAAAAYGGHRLT